MSKIIYILHYQVVIVYLNVITRIECNWKRKLFAVGIGGEKCDQCARGFIQDAILTADHPVQDRQIPHGEMPMCLPCGECFTNWDRILADLRNQTDEQIARAEQVNHLWMKQKSLIKTKVS